MQETKANLEQTVQETKVSLEQTVQETKASVNTLEQSVNERFNHVYGKLADIDANLMEMRNLLAFLVEKQK